MNNIENAIKQYYIEMLTTDRLYAEISRKSGISFTQMIILYHLEHIKDVTQKNLCNDLALPKQTVNTILSNWKKEGILEFYFTSGNQKNKYIRLTSKGIIYLNKSLDNVHKIEEKVMRLMGPSNMEALIKTNNLYTELLKEEVKKL